MKHSIFLCMAVVLMLASSAFGQEIYRWTDEKGNAHFTDDFSLVPERYQKQVRSERVKEEPPAQAVSTPEAAPKGGVPAAPPSGETPGRDRLGRDEGWWKSRVEEWSDKLTKAQKSYDAARAAVSDKVKELDDARFKPESLKRRLRGEIKDLEEKVKGPEKELEEARRMLDQTLPREAEEARAPADWVKPKSP
jgi:hypothetical protein